jgi:hypothetical protein
VGLIGSDDCRSWFQKPMRHVVASPRWAYMLASGAIVRRTRREVWQQLPQGGPASLNTADRSR